MRINVLSVLGILLAVTSLASGQDGEDGTSRRAGRGERGERRAGRGERGERRAGRGEGRERRWQRGEGENEGRRERRARRRERMERMENATAEERRVMRVDRWVDRLSRTYELDDGQRDVVRAEIDGMSRDYYKNMGADNAARMDELRMDIGRRWRDARRRREEGEDIDWRNMANDPEFIAKREALEALRADHPFDFDAGLERVEKLLPEEQVAEGRTRREAWQKRRRERRESRGNGDWRGGRGGEGRGRMGGDRRESKIVERSNWEKYTIEVIEKYGFDGAQVNSARSILKDIQDRAAVIERALNNPAALAGPFAELFKELRSRLESLATDRQRKAATPKST